MNFLFIIIIPVMAKFYFQLPILQSSVSHDTSEINLIADLLLKEYFLLLSMLKKKNSSA